jgi:tetratricopeptide (TPR) repeat protein
VELGKELVGQNRFADALTLVNRLRTVLEVERETTTEEAEILPPEPHLIREPSPAYRPVTYPDAETRRAVALLKDMLSVVALVASVRMEGSPPEQYEQALQALELARQVDRATGEVLELSKWVREASGYEFVELEEADRWPPRLAYLVHLAARYEQDENWSAAIDAYCQARELLDPTKGDEELARHTEIGFRLALCLKQDGRWSEALKLQEENAAAYKRLGDLYGKANAYMEMGHIFEMMNIHDPALLYYGEAYYLYRQVAEEAREEDRRRLARRGMANAKESLGYLEMLLKVLPNAVSDLEEAEQLYMALDMPGKAAVMRQHLEDARAAAGGSGE